MLRSPRYASGESLVQVVTCTHLVDVTSPEGRIDPVWSTPAIVCGACEALGHALSLRILWAQHQSLGRVVSQRTHRWMNDNGVCDWTPLDMFYSIPPMKALENKMKLSYLHSHTTCMEMPSLVWKCLVWKLTSIFKAMTSPWDENDTRWRVTSVRHSSVMYLVVNAVRDPETVSKPILRGCLNAKGKLRLGLATVQLWEHTGPD